MSTNRSMPLDYAPHSFLQVRTGICSLSPNRKERAHKEMLCYVHSLMASKEGLSFDGMFYPNMLSAIHNFAAKISLRVSE